MLQMRPGCECCDVDLPADQRGAMICSCECTWCEACARDCLDGVCPNCGGRADDGGLVARPTRVGGVLQRNPASTARVVQAGLHRG